MHATSAQTRLSRPGLLALVTVLAAVSVAGAVASLPVYAYKTSRLDGGEVHNPYADDPVAGILFLLTGAFLVRHNAQNWRIRASFHGHISAA